MYILPPVRELSIVGIFDAGIPNRERIVLRPTEPLNLAAFGLILSTAGSEGVTPIPNQFLWLGERWIAPPAWIVVFTGPGRFQEGTHQTSGEPVLELHWGQPGVVLGQAGIAVSVLRIGALTSQITPYNRTGDSPAIEALW